MKFFRLWIVLMVGRGPGRGSREDEQGILRGTNGKGEGTTTEEGRKGAGEREREGKRAEEKK
jgi:hypothetical protein